MAGPELKQYLDKKVAIKLNANRYVTGILRSYDKFMNVTLDDAVEGKDEKHSVGTVVALSPNNAEREEAENTLQNIEQNSGFLSLLISIFSNLETEFNIRVLAAIYFKNSIAKYWRTTSNGAVSEEEKQYIRQQILNLTVNETNNLLFNQHAESIAKIARNDFPTNWSGLFDEIRESIESSGETGIRAIYLLHRLIKELASKKLSNDKKIFAQVASELLPFTVSLWQHLMDQVQHQYRQEQQQHHHHQISLITQATLWCTRCIRRMIVYSPHPVLPTDAGTTWLSSTAAAIDHLTTHQGSHPAAMRLTAALVKAALACFAADRDAFQPYLDQFLALSTQLVLSVNRPYDRDNHPHNNDSDSQDLDQSHPSPIQQVLSRCLQLIGQVAAAASPWVSNPLPPSLVNTILSPSRRTDLLHHITAVMLPLDSGSIAEWQNDPESFVLSQDLDWWTDALRPAAETTLAELIETFPDDLGAAAVQYAQQSVEQVVPLLSPNHDHHSGSSPSAELIMARTLEAEAALNAVGVGGYGLYSLVPLQQWWVSWMRPLMSTPKTQPPNLGSESNDPNPVTPLSIIQRRILLLIPCFSDQLTSSPDIVVSPHHPDEPGPNIHTNNEENNNNNNDNNNNNPEVTLRDILSAYAAGMRSPDGVIALTALVQLEGMIAMPEILTATATGSGIDEELLPAATDLLQRVGATESQLKVLNFMTTAAQRCSFPESRRRLMHVAWMVWDQQQHSTDDRAGIGDGEGDRCAIRAAAVSLAGAVVPEKQYSTQYNTGNVMDITGGEISSSSSSSSSTATAWLTEEVIQGAVVPLIRGSVDPQRPEHIYAAEEGLALWSRTLKSMHARLLPELQDLFTSMLPYLAHQSAEHVQDVLSITECSVVLGGPDWLSQHRSGPDNNTPEMVAHVVGNVLGAYAGTVRDHPSMRLLAVTETCLQVMGRAEQEEEERTAAVTAAMTTPVLTWMVAALRQYADPGTSREGESEMVLAEMVVVLGRIILTFRALLDAVRVHHDYLSVEDILRNWVSVALELVDSILSASRRRICCIALCQVLSHFTHHHQQQPEAREWILSHASPAIHLLARVLAEEKETTDTTTRETTAGRGWYDQQYETTLMMDRVRKADLDTAAVAVLRDTIDGCQGWKTMKHEVGEDTLRQVFS